MQLNKCKSIRTALCHTTSSQPLWMRNMSYIMEAVIQYSLWSTEIDFGESLANQDISTWSSETSINLVLWVHWSKNNWIYLTVLTSWYQSASRVKRQQSYVPTRYDFVSSDVLYSHPFVSVQRQCFNTVYSSWSQPFDSVETLWAMFAIYFFQIKKLWKRFNFQVRWR